MIIPWWRSVVWTLSMVDSWPPCCVAEHVNTLPILSTRARSFKSRPVASRNWRICPHIFPNRVGVPKIRKNELSYFLISSNLFSICSNSCLRSFARVSSIEISSFTRLGIVVPIILNPPLLYSSIASFTVPVVTVAIWYCFKRHCIRVYNHEVFAPSKFPVHPCIQISRRCSYTYLHLFYYLFPL